MPANPFKLVISLPDITMPWSNVQLAILIIASKSSTCCCEFRTTWPVGQIKGASTQSAAWPPSVIVQPKSSISFCRAAAPSQNWLLPPSKVTPVWSCWLLQPIKISS